MRHYLDLSADPRLQDGHLRSNAAQLAAPQGAGQQVISLNRVLIYLACKDDPAFLRISIVAESTLMIPLQSIQQEQAFASRPTSFHGPMPDTNPP